MKKQLLFLFFIVSTFSSCGILRNAGKREFNNGFYIQKNNNEKSKVFVDVIDDSFHVHDTYFDANKIMVDTNTYKTFPKEVKSKTFSKTSFKKYSFDIDFITIPLKFRLKEMDIPAQLNTNLNGALYIGYRADKYLIGYESNHLGKAIRKVNHVGFSMGAFSGFGNTLMSPTNTHDRLQKEYDGIVWSKGISGFLIANSFTVGLALGVDHLLDKNKTIWIYQNKPWLGLSVGLHLN